MDDETHHGFGALGLRPELLIGVARLGFSTMTDIQAAALPVALEGRDLVGHARTGSGKTAAFGLALLQQVEPDRVPQALVLCPTRELAQQLTTALRALAVGLEGLRVLSLTGGAPVRAQRDALSEGAHVIVGTPGRTLQHLMQRRLDPRRVRCLVLDEADRMLDMGFEDEVQSILGLVPEPRQTLLFSATWPEEMQELSARIQRDPVVVGVQTQISDTVLRQRAVLCTAAERPQKLLDVLSAQSPCPTLVFCETRDQCREVVAHLQAAGADALTLHGELEQRDRDEVLVQLRNDSTRILVATNVAARGLDLEGLGLVVCYELSPEPEVHVHRIGRTARGASEGAAVSLVAGPRELRRLEAIEATMGVEIPRVTWLVSGGGLPGWTAPNRTLVIHGGRKDKLRPGDILGALTGDVGLEGSDVGKIVLTDRRGWVAVRAEVAAGAARSLGRTHIKRRRFRVHLVQ